MLRHTINIEDELQQKFYVKFYNNLPISSTYKQRPRPDWSTDNGQSAFNRNDPIDAKHTLY